MADGKTRDSNNNCWLGGSGWTFGKALLGTVEQVPRKAVELLWEISRALLDKTAYEFI